MSELPPEWHSKQVSPFTFGELMELVDMIGNMRVTMLGIAESLDPGLGDHIEHMGAEQLRGYARTLRNCANTGKLPEATE